MNELKLCYAETDTAYFTSKPLDEQWGDDWNDAPYEHNAGQPYAYYEEYDKGKEPWEIKSVKFYGPFDLPCDDYSNSPYSVQDINAGEVPWLASQYAALTPVKIYAGTPYDVFVELVKAAGGSIIEQEETP